MVAREKAMLLQLSTTQMRRVGWRMIGALIAFIVPPAWSQCEPLEVSVLAASDGHAGDEFGVSVAIDGATALVGADLDYVLGQAAAGSAYVFVNSGGVWTQQVKLVAPDPAAMDFFGWDVALSGDTALIGAERDDDFGTDSGAVYVFVRSNGVWAQQAKLTASAPEAYGHFGSSVAIQGDTALIGADIDGDRGAAYILVRSEGTWTQSAKLVPAGGSLVQQFGFSVALDGDTALVGAISDSHSGLTGPGSAYVFVRTNEVWMQEAKLIASDAGEGDHLGWRVAVQNDTAVVGAPFNGQAGTNAGAAYVFVRSAGTWAEQSKLAPADALAGDIFGVSVALHADQVLVGASQSGYHGPGAAYLFTRSGAVWAQTAKLTEWDPDAADHFGCSVALDVDTAIVGASYDDHPGATNAGSAFLFDLRPNCACCLPDGTCLPDLSEAQCAEHNGTVFPGVICDSELCPAGCLPADSNCDGVVNTFDIDPFVLALTDEAAWHATFSCDYLCANDTNADGAVNAFDIDPFVAYLVSEVRAW
jgi:hypothetical protein